MADNGVREPAYADIELTVLCKYLKAYSFTFSLTTNLFPSPSPSTRCLQSLLKNKISFPLFFLFSREWGDKKEKNVNVLFLCLCYIESIRAHIHTFMTWKTFPLSDRVVIFGKWGDEWNGPRNIWAIQSEKSAVSKIF